MDASLRESEDANHPTLTSRSQVRSHTYVNTYIQYIQFSSYIHYIHTFYSKVWKDLQRDAIRINNENVSGACDMGAENIVGALLRHISDKVEFARSQVFSQERSSSQRLSPKGKQIFMCVYVVCMYVCMYVL